MVSKFRDLDVTRTIAVDDVAANTKKFWSHFLLLFQLSIYKWLQLLKSVSFQVAARSPNRFASNATMQFIVTISARGPIGMEAISRGVTNGDSHC